MSDRRALMSAIEERLDDSTAVGLAGAVGLAIRDGVLPPGTKLPPIREVAKQLALSPTTVSAAWRLLSRAGTIRPDGRRGTTVAEAAAGSVRYRQALGGRAGFTLDLSTGVPDADLLPSLRSSLAELTTAGTPSSYLDAPVLPELEETLRRTWPYEPSRLTVVDGALDALDQVTRSVLRFRDRVVVEHPCFPPILDLLEAAGVEVVGVPLDDQGLQLEPLRAVLDKPARALVLQPRGQNPTGVTMATRRARAIAALLGQTDTVVIEDDSTGEIATSPPVSLGRWIPEQTVHIRSFSKSHGPDLRLAAVSGPEGLMEEVLARRQLGQGWSSRLLQRMLLHLLTDPGPVGEVAAARQTYADRRKALVTALAERDVVVGGVEGLNIWVPVDDEAAALIRLASQGIGVAPGRPFTVLPEEGGHLRVTAGLVADGVEEIAAAIADASRVAPWGSAGA